MTYAVAGGAALALAFPGANLWPLAWIALAPFIMTLRNVTPRHGAILGLVFGAVFYGILLHWIRLFGYLPWALLILVEALTVALYGAAASLLTRRTRPVLSVIGIAALWVLIEWLRSLGPAGFTWGSLAYSQAYNLPTARIASITGPWGVSFLVVLVNAAIVEIILARDARQRLITAAIPLVLLAAVMVWGSGKQSGFHARPLKVAMVQASLPQMVNPPADYSAKQWDVYSDLTAEAVKQRPNFIVWPESALPDDIEQSFWLDGEMQRFARMSSADIVTGGVRAAERNGKPAEQNCAYVITKEGIKDSYHKVRLVPFGEYVPARKWLGIAKRYGVREIDYIPGPRWHALNTSYGRAGAVICFESAFPQISRALVNDGARLLFVLTNDGWFARTAAAEQHLQMSVFRAIENGRYVVRSTSTGISAVIAPDGSLQKKLPLWKRGVLIGEVRMLSSTTPYARFGDWFAYLCAVTAGVLITTTRKGRKHKREDAGTRRHGDAAKQPIV